MAVLGVVLPSKMTNNQTKILFSSFIFFQFLSTDISHVINVGFTSNKNPSNDPSETIVFSNNLEASEEQQRLIALHVMTNTRSCRKWLRTKNPEKSWKVGKPT